MKYLLKLLVFTLLLGLLNSNPLKAQKTGVEISGDVLEVIMPVAALGSTFIWKDDTKPTMQYIHAAGSAFVITHALKWIIDKPRPNGGRRAFPSGHTSAAFSSAAFIQKRYGWKAGLPAYILSGYVGWTRIYAEKHDIWDVLAGAAIGVGTSYIFTKPYRSDKVTVAFFHNGNRLGMQITLM